MKSVRKRRETAIHSPLDLANKHLALCMRWIIGSLVLPLPLIASAVVGFNYFYPHWYKDLFLWAILLLFASGQVGSLFQLLGLNGGARKAARVLAFLKKSGDRPEIQNFQQQLMFTTPACHIRDNVLRWIRLGIQGNTEGLERMMEQTALRRDQNAATTISFHTLINRTTLKMGFLGTLIGLIMTFEPMKQAMLALQSSRGEFRFVTDMVRAIDGDSYAIVTTLLATALSIFVELVTIQCFERIFHQFEIMNSNLENWCIIQLQPWISEIIGRKKRYDGTAEYQKRFAETEAIPSAQRSGESAGGENGYGALIEFQKEFAAKVVAMQQTMDEQLRTLSSRVNQTGQQITGLVSIQEAIDKKISDLADGEEQYRRFLQSKLQRVVPAADDAGEHP
jgi:hypothetical protein